MSRLVEAARAYEGVKFRHRGRSRMGLDCAGLPWVAYRDCGMILPDFRLYGREPHKDGLVQRASEALGEPVAQAPVAEEQLQAGDVIIIRYDIRPHHIMIVTDYPLGGLGVIHTDGHYGRVLEHRLSADIVARITHVFRRSV